MLHKRNNCFIALFFMTILVLSGCSNSKGMQNDPVVGGDGPQDGSPGNEIPLSEALEKFPVWFTTAENPVRDSFVSNIFVFEKGKVSGYRLKDVKIEDIVQLSDKELVEFAKENSGSQLDTLAQDIRETSITKSVIEKNGDVVKDIYLEFDENEDRKVLKSEYILDIELDEYGQNTETINLIMPEVIHTISSLDVTDYEASHFIGLMSDYYAYGFDTNYTNDVENYGSSLDELKEFGTFSDDSEKPLIDSYKPDPITWDTEDVEIQISQGYVNAMMFDTNFSGFPSNNGSLVTRVKEGFPGFSLDDSKTKKNNITVEGK